MHALAVRLPEGSVTVYAPAWEGRPRFDAAQPFPVERHPDVPDAAGAVGGAPGGPAASSRGGCDTVLFGAAAPLGLLAPSLRRAGARRLVAITHGHEAGWAALPGARSLLRRIGDSVDTVTYLGEYTRARLARALSPAAAARMTRLAPGVDSEAFRPGAGVLAVRDRLGLASLPVVICVSRLVPRKGQDTLIRAWPEVRAAVPDAVLLLVGGGPYAPAGCGGLPVGLGWLTGHLHRAGALARAATPTTTPGTCSRCPAAPAGTAWTSRARHRLPEASATGLPVIGGDPGTRPTPSGTARPGTSSRGAARRKSLAGSCTCSPIQRAPGPWARRAWPGSTRNGGGTWSRSGCSEILAGRLHLGGAPSAARAWISQE